MIYRVSASFIILLIVQSCISEDNSADWKVAGGNEEREQFSTSSILTPGNVNELTVAWVYRSGDAHKGSQIQCNPIIVDNTLYGTTAGLKLVALNAQSGKEQWVFDPATVLREGDYSPGMNVNRGVTYWSDGTDHRIFYVVGPYLFSVDALSGKNDNTFGDSGKVDLHDNLDRDVSGFFITATSPGVIYEDKLILGSRVSEGGKAAPGHIRAFNVHSGDVEWIFHTIPHPGEKGYDSWDDTTAYRRSGGANAWSGFSIDKQRGMVFAGTGSASFDFYGGDRTGSNLFANSVLALDAATGEYKWHYQTIHHDVWDRDLPAPPVLATIKVNGSKKDVVIQATKAGFIFVLDRKTGKPVFPVEEQAVPAVSSLVGEKLWPTQPIPIHNKPFMRQSFDEDALNDLIPDSSFNTLRNQFRSYNSGEIFTPPSGEGTIFFPGLDGGAEWGGSSFDRENGILYVNSNEVPWVMTNVPVFEATEISGSSLYQNTCMACHGPNLEGAGNYPQIADAGSRLSESDMLELLGQGRRMMPSFDYLSDQEKKEVIRFVREFSTRDEKVNYTQNNDYVKGYTITGYHKFQTPEGLPAIKPPWGRLNALDIVSGEIKWQVPLGEYPGLDSLGYVTGTENYGGPVATAGGLIFIAATLDSKIRAFDKTTGEVIWEDDLPVPGYATPAIYEIEGRPFLVIACGGGKLGSESGDYYIAYSLPFTE